jgi:hypothetical protein
VTRKRKKAESREYEKTEGNTRSEVKKGGGKRKIGRVTEGGKVGRWGEGVGSWGREGRVQ